MSTVSVPLSAELEKDLDGLIKSGYGSNKADVIRRALRNASEEEAIRQVLQAQHEISIGKGLVGDIRELVKKIK